MSDVSVAFQLPDPLLRTLVSSYYEMTVPGDVPVEDYLHPEWANIRLTLEHRWDMGSDSATAKQMSTHAIIHGPTSRPTFLRGRGKAFGIGILPGGWHRFWNKDASFFADRMAPLSDLIGAEPAEQLAATFQNAGDLEARAKLADAYLLDRLAQFTATHMTSRVDALFQVLTDPANATVEQIGETLGLPQARLARLCKRGFGFPPKLLLRRQRFLRMLGTLHARPYEEWPDFIDPQYVDQSHMIRDFQFFLGMSPSRYFALDRPILAAAAAARAKAMGQPLQGLHLPRRG
jgi:AraC-like DNA-binding protein